MSPMNCTQPTTLHCLVNLTGCYWVTSMWAPVFEGPFFSNPLRDNVQSHDSVPINVSYRLALFRSAAWVYQTWVQPRSTPTTLQEVKATAARESLHQIYHWACLTIKVTNKQLPANSCKHFDVQERKKVDPHWQIKQIKFTVQLALCCNL